VGQFHNPAQREKPAYLGDEIQIDFLKKFAPQSLQVLSSQIEPLVRLPISVMIKEDGISNVHNIGSGKGIPAC
jgi:hypothetical protein